MEVDDLVKKGYYSNKKKSLIIFNKKKILTKKRNLINLNTRECSKKLNHICLCFLL